MITEAQKRATLKYYKEKITYLRFSLNKVIDADIIEKLNSVDNRQGYVKELIRRDIKKG